jgi:hypothetical protein
MYVELEVHPVRPLLHIREGLVTGTSQVIPVCQEKCPLDSLVKEADHRHRHQTDNEHLFLSLCLSREIMSYQIGPYPSVVFCLVIDCGCSGS